MMTKMKNPGAGQLIVNNIRRCQTQTRAKKQGGKPSGRTNEYLYSTYVHHGWSRHMDFFFWRRLWEEERRRRYTLIIVKNKQQTTPLRAIIAELLYSLILLVGRLGEKSS
jgi:hypothetical protein